MTALAVLRRMSWKRGSGAFPILAKYLKVNIVYLWFTDASTLPRAHPLISFIFFLPPVSTPDLLRAKILWFSIETSPFPGNIDVFFVAGVMIWWIRISKPWTMAVFMVAFLSLSGFVLLFKPLVSQMNTNIVYSVDVHVLVTSAAFQRFNSLLEQQVLYTGENRLEGGLFLSFFLSLEIYT